MDINVINKINCLINSKEMFTAYDVTKSLRNDGTIIEHEDVRNEVHKMYSNGNMDPSYERTIKNFGGQKAWIYHHLTSDLDNYKPVTINYTKNNNFPASSASSISSVSRNNRNKQPVNGALNNAMAQHDGRLNIPKALLKKTLLHVIKVNVSDNDVILSHPSKKFSSVYKTHSITVQNDGSVQLPKKFLKKSKKYYQIYIKDGCIYVE